MSSATGLLLGALDAASNVVKGHGCACFHLYAILSIASSSKNSRRPYLPTLPSHVCMSAPSNILHTASYPLQASDNKIHASSPRAPFTVADHAFIYAPCSLHSASQGACHFFRWLHSPLVVGSSRFSLHTSACGGVAPHQPDPAATLPQGCYMCCRK